MSGNQFKYICQSCRLELKFHLFERVVKMFCPICRKKTEWHAHAL